MAQRSRAVIFDLDGTLVDSEPAYFEAGRQVFARHGVDYDWDVHARFIGVGTRETLATLREEYGLDTGLDELLAEKNAAYLRLVPERTRPYPRMVELLDRLDAAGIPAAVASGSSRSAIAAALGAAGLADRFRFTLSAEEVEHGKPAPDVFLAAADRLGAAPGECTVLEDAAPGCAAARRAGCRCVAVPSVPPGPGEPLDPEFAAAGLLFRGGQPEFDPDAAFAFITGEPHGGGPDAG